jgi:hypothetical protein
MSVKTSVVNPKEESIHEVDEAEGAGTGICTARAEIRRKTAPRIADYKDSELAAASG